MKGQDVTSPDGPLIAESSRMFAVLAAAALIVAGIAGVAADSSDDGHGTAVAGATVGHDEVAPHGHGDGTAAPSSGGSHGHGPAAVAAGHSGSMGHGASHADHVASVRNATASHGGGHGGAAASGDETASGRGDHGDHGSVGDAGHGGMDHGDDAHADGHDAHAGHAGCSDDHPATKDLVAKVQLALDDLYPDIATLVARGYIPYFDAFFPGGYPPGGEGISHWIRPQYIEDGVVLDPLRPETILLDDWWNPIGMMFIADPNEGTKPVYVNADGTACSPWHPHTDYPARFGWWFYRVVYDDAAGDGEVDLPERTPEMMHVWAVKNPLGVYEAHNYPPQSSRKGGPEPRLSYFRES